MFYLALYVAIGNSDNKLDQWQWSEFCREVNESIRAYAHEVHGEWYSLPNVQWQNACWSFVLNDTGKSQQLALELKRHAQTFDQDSIVWSEVAVTKFITGD
jgi:hypothetical protein